MATQLYSNVSPPVSTHAVTVNTAFLEDIKRDNIRLKSLLQEARSVCEACPFGRVWRIRLATLLGDLRDVLALHFTLEEFYGYFEEPLAVAPHLAERAKRLRAQHVDLYDAISFLADMAADLAAAGDDVFRVQQLATCYIQFHNRLLEHEAGEDELITDAYNVDIGVGD
ncbi:MAG: hypothetical protein WDZ59_13130 [Pirellulales bacterium]